MIRVAPGLSPLLGLLPLLVAALLGAPSPAEAKPDWVKRNGLSEAFPVERFVTGYGVASGGEALERAKRDAAADLARKLSVRIESDVQDVSQETNGDYSYKLAAVTRATTDVQLTNLRYEEPYKRWGKTYVLAWLERKPAAQAQLGASEQAMVDLRACMASADEAQRADRKKAALERYETCRAPIAKALHHDAVARALVPSLRRDKAVYAELARASREIDGRIESTLSRPATSLGSATDALALQLDRQGMDRSRRIVVSHLSYGATNLSSTFGRQAGRELERALAASQNASASPTRDAMKPRGLTDSGATVVTGTYLELDDRLRLIVTCRDLESGRLVASAESSMPLAAVPAHLELKPSNFNEALKDQRVLTEGGLHDGALRLEIWTDRGRGGVLYEEHDQLTLYMRVNQPGWVRLIYVLQNGDKVPIDQAFQIGKDKVDQVVAYPETFEVIPPFGVEMIHATAFTEKPPILATRNRRIDGQDYQIIADGLGSIERTRGIARKRKQQIAEDTVTVTTMPRF